MDSGYIYGIYNDINMKHYIGQTKHTPEQRFKRHLYDALHGDMAPLHVAMRKYGVEHFHLVPIEQTTLLDRREKYWIKCYRSNKIGYNCTEGGQGRKGGEVHDNLPTNDAEALMSQIDSLQMENTLLASALRKKDEEIDRIKIEKEDLEIQIIARGRSFARAFGL